MSIEKTSSTWTWKSFWVRPGATRSTRGTEDVIYKNLDTRPAFRNIDLHGKSRYLFFILIEGYVFFGGKAILQFYGEGFLIGLIFTFLFLPVLYVAVWGAIATQWLIFVIIGAAYLWIAGTREFGSGGSGGIFGALESNQKSMDSLARRTEKFKREQNFFK